MRQLAAAGFEQSVHRYGVRIAPAEIVAQYDRYNESTKLDKATQQLLGSILDTIEGPKTAKSGEPYRRASNSFMAHLCIEQRTAIQEPAEERATGTFCSEGTANGPVPAGSRIGSNPNLQTDPVRDSFMPVPLAPLDPHANGPPIKGLIGSAGDDRGLPPHAAGGQEQCSVLLLGETGTGKELIAKAVHQLSPRGSGPFVRVNCGALTRKPAGKRIVRPRARLVHRGDRQSHRPLRGAHTGTIFLDEINSTTPKLQVKLLRVLQEREFERVGDTQTIRVDTRVIAASNRDLVEEVEKPSDFAKTCITG